MKILVSGDREWTDVDAIYEALKDFPSGTILIHGAARGADTIAALIGDQLGFDCRPYPYLSQYGRAGGPMRNTQMAQENPDIEQVIGFHNNIEESKGTKDMLRRVAPKYLPNATIKLVTSKVVEATPEAV
jgi:hypothetical protein